MVKRANNALRSCAKVAAPAAIAACLLLISLLSACPVSAQPIPPAEVSLDGTKVTLTPAPFVYNGVLQFNIAAFGKLVGEAIAIDAREKSITVTRKDGSVFVLYPLTGEVTINAKPAGYVQAIPVVLSADQAALPMDIVSRMFKVEMLMKAQRLNIYTKPLPDKDLPIFANGSVIDLTKPPLRWEGQILLPIGEIAKLTNSSATAVPADNLVQIKRRNGESVSFNISTGIITVNGTSTARPAAGAVAIFDDSDVFLPIGLIGQLLEIDASVSGPRISLQWQNLAPGEDLTVFVDGNKVALPFPPRIVGDYTFLPIEPLASAVQVSVQLHPENNTIVVIRSRDSSIFIFDTFTGQATINGIPAGTFKPSTGPILMIPGQTYLPLDLLALALGSSIEQKGNRLDILAGSLASPTLIKPSTSWKSFALDYGKYELYERSFLPSPLGLNTGSTTGTTTTQQTANNSASGDGTNQQGKPTPNIGEIVTLGTGGHWGPLIIDGGVRLAGGTGAKFLNFSSAYARARDPRNGALYDGGDIILKDHNIMLDGSLGRGGQVSIPFKGQFRANAFFGGTLTGAKDLGGGTSRFLYHRPEAIGEVMYEPNKNFTTSLSTMVFSDLRPFQIVPFGKHGAYVSTMNSWTSKSWDGTAMLAAGHGKQNPLLHGPAYAIDFRGRRRLFWGISTNGTFDRYSARFANPQLTSSYQNREDRIFTVNWTPTRRFSAGLTLATIKTQLELNQPPSSTSQTAFVTISPWKKGPLLSISGIRSESDPGSTALLNNNNNILSQFTTSVDENGNVVNNASNANNLNLSGGKLRQNLGNILLTHSFGSNQYLANVVTVQSESAGTSTTTTNINLEFSHQFLNSSRLAVQSIFNNQELFQILSIFQPPSYRGVSVSFGPGYGKNSAGQRFIFLATLNSRLPYIGNFLSNWQRLLTQTTTEGRLAKTVPLRRGTRAKNTLDANNFSSISGTVFISSKLPPTAGGQTPRFPDIDVYLDGRQNFKARTNSRGQYRFESVPVGRHRVDINLSQLPAEYSLSSPGHAYVQVFPYQTVVADFAISKVGHLEGKLIPASQELSQSQLANLRIYLDGGDRWETLSNDDGTFRITDVIPGPHTLYMDPLYASDEIEIPPPQVVSIDPDGTANVQITVKHKPREVERKKF